MDFASLDLALGCRHSKNNKANEEARKAVKVAPSKDRPTARVTVNKANPTVLRRAMVKISMVLLMLTVSKAKDNKMDANKITTNSKEATNRNKVSKGVNKAIRDIN